MANREQRSHRETKKPKKEKPKIAPSVGGSIAGIFDKPRAAGKK
jgi:hypothetical protein